MNKLQTMAAALVLMFGIFIGIFFLFKDPIPYAYNNLPNKLSQAMHQNGVHWAKIRVDGNEVFISGIAPNSSEMFFAKSLIQKESGVSANFIGVEVRNVKTRDDFNSEGDWEDFQKKNPGGIFVNTSPFKQARSNSGATSVSTGNKTDTTLGTNGSSNQDLLHHDQYILNFQTKTPKCKAKNRLNTNDYEIIFKGNTAVIDHRSLTDLDWIAEFDETCTLDLKLFRIGKKDETNLRNRKIDEVRYHLMSAGILSKRIVTDNQ